MTDRHVWDDMAVTQADAFKAIWSEPAPDAYTARAGVCVEQIEPAIRSRLRWHAPTILDLGCGAGRITGPIAAGHPQATFVGLDVSPNMIGHATRAPNIVYIVGDGRHIPPSIGPLAAAWSMLLFQHLDPDDVERYIVEVAELLATDGLFRFQYVEGDEHQALSHGYREDQIVGWCKAAGFEVPYIDRGVIYPGWTWVTGVKV